MRLIDVRATPDPRGNRILVTWSYPPGADMPGMRVVRREGTHPEEPDDGVEVAVSLPGTGVRSATDIGLNGETVYYYTLFPFRGQPPQFEPDSHNRVAAMATSPHDFAGLMYRLLPEIYRRYDTVHASGRAGDPDDPDDANPTDGVLRRFLDLPGTQLDQLYSFTRAALGLCDVDRVDGELLPLLAAWIGWRTNFALPVAAQRNEVRQAPQLFRTIGTVPNLEATVARVTGWSCRTKEYVHNVARTNQPERLMLWSVSRNSSGTWGTPTPASQHFAYEGRPGCTPLADGSLLFVYHTLRRHGAELGWDIWAKRFADGVWEPSEPVVTSPDIDKHPTIARQGDRLWLFWETRETQAAGSDRPWRIALRTRTQGDWSPGELFGDGTTERRLPSATVDTAGGLWVFWLERAGIGWQVRYNRHDGAAWQLTTPGTVPIGETGAPGPDGDLVAVAHPSNPAAPLWLFWAQRAPAGPGGAPRWAIGFSSKQSLDPDPADWSAPHLVPRTGAEAAHHREPAPMPTAAGGIDLFWSRTGASGWSVVHSLLNTATLTFGPVQQVTTSAYSERAPSPADTGSGTLLLTYRSNESLTHTSTVYAATHTLDARYAGTTTVDTRGAEKLALRGQFEDFQTYTYDGGHRGVRTNDDRISRDTVGLYLVPSTTDVEQVRVIVAQLRSALAEFMPIGGRAVFITP